MSGFSQWAVSVACLLAVSGCGGAPSAPGDVPYGRAVDLRIGEPIRVGDDGLQVTFESVKSDSRCPIDANCIQEGDAVIAVLFRVDGASTSRDLHTDLAKAEARLDRYSVRLLSLQPYPRSDHPAQPGDYIAQVRVDRR